MAGTYLIALFDIDGTLVSTGGAGAVAWKQAFQELHGVPVDILEYTDIGMTDPHVGAPTVGGAAIGVATGSHDAAALREAGADRVLPTLEQELPLR